MRRNKILALDIDGVFIPDLVWDSSKKDELLYFRHYHMTPIFNPSFDYFLITGRLEEDRKDTMQWVKTHFKKKPLYVFHKNDNLANAAHYKATVLNGFHDISLFIESCPEQAQFIRQNVRPSVKIVTMNQLMEKALENVFDI